MSSQTPTLRDIADRAGVSVATVSYVLNGKGRLSDERRRTIQGLLRDAGLRPRNKRQPVLYLCSREHLNHAAALAPFVDRMTGLDTVLRSSELSLRLAMVDPGTGLVGRLREAAALKPAGVLVDTILGESVADTLQFFAKRGIPGLQIGHTDWAAGFDAVVVDDFGGAYAGVQHLTDAGHERIATIRWNTQGDPASSRKHAGFRCAMHEADRRLAPELIVTAPYKREADRLTGRVAIEQLLALDHPPTAVFVENSFVSPSLLYPTGPHEQAVPEAIAALDMVHFESWHLDSVEQVMCGVFSYPRRDTKLLRINWEEIGRTAARRLAARVEGEPATGEVVRVAPQLRHVQAMQESVL